MISPDFYKKANLVTNSKYKYFPQKDPTFGVSSYPYVLREGETVVSVAERIFGNNTGLWTVLADLNAPRRFEDWLPGDTIILPTSVVELQLNTNTFTPTENKLQQIKPRWSNVIAITTIVDGSASVIEHIFVPSDGLISFTSVAMKNKNILFSLDGFIQSSIDQYTFDSSTGTITPATPFAIGQRLVVYTLSAAVGTNPINHNFTGGASSYTNAALTGFTNILVALDGIIQTPTTHYSYNSSTGVITPVTAYLSGQRLTVAILSTASINHTLAGMDSIVYYVNTALINKIVGFIIDGMVQCSIDQFTFNPLSGLITPISPMNLGQELTIVIL